MAAPRKTAKFANFMEQAYGFSQAVQVGDTIYVSGQTAFGDDGVVGAGDMAVQMRAAYEAIGRVLAEFGAGLSDVVDETLFVTDTMAAATVAHAVREEVYGSGFPVASTLIGVQALGAPELMIEIKCTARTG
jgi:enamine deaminase RidA (YjgF/YER057c/UK114 family)